MGNNEQPKSIFKEAKSLILAMLIGSLGTIIVEEYRLLRKDEDLDKVNKEKKEIFQFATRLDTLLKETHKANVKLVENQKELKAEILTAQEENRRITEQALQVVSLDSIDVLSDTEFDSIRCSLRNQYHVISNNTSSTVIGN